MDPFLAQMYGTAETVGAVPSADDIEKLAQAKFIDSLAQAEEGVTYDDLPPEVIVKVAHDIFGDSSLLKTAEDVEEAKPEKKDEAPPKKMEAKEEEDEEEEEESEEAKEAALQEKIAEADFLGRVMAHANVQEHAIIEKQAADYGKAQKEEHQRIARGHGRMGAVGWGGTGAGLGAAAGGMSGGSMKARIAKGALGAALGGTLGGAAGYGAGYGSTRAANRIARAVGGEGSKKKEGSDINAMVEARAFEMLKEAGYVQEEAPEVQFEKAAEHRALEMLSEAGYDVEAMQKQAEVDRAVEMRALEMLKEAGYPVEE